MGSNGLGRSMSRSVPARSARRSPAALRGQLLDLLTDADLGHALPGNPPLGVLCREAGRLDEIYIDSFRKDFPEQWRQWIG